MKDSKKIQKIKPITLEIDEDLWIEFKNRVPRTITLNDAIIKLIEMEIKEGEYLNRDIKKEAKKNV